MITKIREDFDRERRIREILELEREPMNEAWAQLESGKGDEVGADELGFSSNYFNQLVKREFIQRIENGYSFIDFPKMPFSLESYCWREACKKVVPNLCQEIDSLVSQQIRLKMISLHHANMSLDVIADYFNLEIRIAKPIFILCLVEEGGTLREIGTQLNISSERIRRILLETGHTTRSIKKIKSSVSDLQQSKLRGEIANWVREHPGCFVHEIASAIGVTENVILKICPRDSRHLILTAKPLRKYENMKKYSDDETLEALRKAYDLRNPMMSMYSSYETRPLSGPFYEKVRKEGLIIGPSQARILQVFGTWKKACDEAEVPSINAVRDVYNRRWTDEDLIEQLAEFLLIAESSSFENFDAWSRLDESRSSSGTVRNQIGSWSISCERALHHLRNNWADA